MEVGGQIHAPAALPPGTEPLVPIDRRLVGPQSRSERGGEEKESSFLESNSDPPAHNLVTTLAGLSQFYAVFISVLNQLATVHLYLL
jgi:hypothetical protein